MRSVVGISLLATGLAWGQTAPESGDESWLAPIGSTTASRLASPSIRPLQIFDRDWIERSGQVSLADLLRDLPLNAVGTQRPFDDFLNRTVLSTVDLRGIGTGSTLVLVDGLRIAADPHEGNDVNLQTLPLAMIERIEILPESAAAIHGANAVGGVINLVTQREFSGVEFSATASERPDRGGEFQQGSALFGAHSDRGRIVAGASHSERGGLQPSLVPFRWDRLENANTFVQLIPSNPPISRFVSTNNIAGCLNMGLPIDSNPSCVYDASEELIQDMSSEVSSLFASSRLTLTDGWDLAMNARHARSAVTSQAIPPEALDPTGPFFRNNPLLNTQFLRISLGSPNHPLTPTSEGGLNPLWNSGPFSVLTEDLLLNHLFVANGPLTR
ncbi:MAG: TonB-dependent receptor plug domain-containing protein, partial [Pseudomonadota bacterium]